MNWVPEFLEPEQRYLPNLEDVFGVDWKINVRSMTCTVLLLVLRFYSGHFGHANSTSLRNSWGTIVLVKMRMAIVSTRAEFSLEGGHPEWTLHLNKELFVTQQASQKSLTVSSGIRFWTLIQMITSGPNLRRGDRTSHA